jgi:hypothetical protein
MRGREFMAFLSGRTLTWPFTAQAKFPVTQDGRADRKLDRAWYHWPFKYSGPANDERYLHVTLAFVLATTVACSFYASIDARGLYHDGVAYLVGISEREWFILFDVRTAVQILRQAPIVLLSKFTSMTPFQLGQVFTFVLLMLPTVLCAFCWFIVPTIRKAWILFPLTYILVGFAATSMHAIGEAAIATSYFWILLFLLVFRTRFVISQTLFLLLCIPAFRLHEGAFPLTSVLLFACAMRMRTAEQPRERLFLGVSALLITAIFVYQIRWIILPQFPTDREAILHGLTRFQFLYVDGHLNLPLVNGTVALLALAAVTFVRATQPPDTAAVRARAITFAWALFALTAIVAALLIEQSFAPLAQLQARYHPVFFSAALGSIVVCLVGLRLPDRLWMHPTTLVILITLCAAQTAADIAATRRWHAFVADLQSRLASARGLIPWETTLQTGDKYADINWRLMATEWTIPVTSIVFAPTNSIKSIISLPARVTAVGSVDPEKPNQLPKLRAIDYEPYQRFFAAQKSGAHP